MRRSVSAASDMGLGGVEGEHGCADGDLVAIEEELSVASEPVYSSAVGRAEVFDDPPSP